MAKTALRLVLGKYDSDEILNESILTGDNKVKLVFPHPVVEATITYVPQMSGLVILLAPQAEKIE